MRSYAAVLALLLAWGLQSCQSPSTGGGTSLAGLQYDSTNGGMTLPEGFHAVVVASHIGAARHVVVRDNGDLYIALNAVHNGGSIAALRDTSGDGVADVIQ